MQDPDLAPARTPREVELGRLWREMKDHPSAELVAFLPDDPIIDREYEDVERIEQEEMEAAEEEYARQLREDW